MILDMHVHTIASDDSMATDDITHTGGAEFSITNTMRDLRRAEMLAWLMVGGGIRGHMTRCQIVRAS